MGPGASPAGLQRHILSSTFGMAALVGSLLFGRELCGPGDVLLGVEPATKIGLRDGPARLTKDLLQGASN